MQNKIRILTMVILIVSMSQISAGPTLIRDHRITDVGITPVLGRGYSISTNTLQSTCLTDVKLTKPSYDFIYKFEELNEDGTTTTSKTTEGKPITTDTVIPQDANNYIRETLKKKGTMTEGSTTITKKQRMVAVIDLDTYYASVDEASTKLSSSAAALLETGDLPGFFSSCGPYYIRSINRRAKLISIFEFDSIDETTNKKFSGQIESQIKGFQKSFKTITTGWWFWRRTEVVPTEIQTKNEINNWTETEEFNKTAKKSNLTITTMAFGLGKRDDSVIVSNDTESFRKSIKEAFISMQDPLTGKVTSVEVVPWVENTEFQIKTKLNEELFKTVTNEKGEPILENGVPKKVKVADIPLYKRKHNLVTNAEFLAQIDAVFRGKLNIYYKAKLCKAYIDENWQEQVGAGREWKPNLKTKPLINNRSGKIDEPAFTAGALDESLKEKLKEEKLLKAAYDFMLNGSTSGAKCVNKMLEDRMVGTPYYSLPECSLLVEKMNSIENEDINNHCMPQLAQ